MREKRKNHLCFSSSSFLSLICAYCQVYCCLKLFSDGTLKLEKREKLLEKAIFASYILSLKKTQLVQNLLLCKYIVSQLCYFSGVL